MEELYQKLYRRIHGGVQFRLRHFASGRFATHCRPVSIAILITERCNAKCVHCDIWKNRGQESNPTADHWKNVLRQLAEWLGPVQVTLTGGEALLRAYTPDLAAYGRSLGLFIEVLTHGYWLEQSRIEQLALANPGRITVSCDGVGDTHSLVRGREKFWHYTHTTLRNLKLLREENNLGYSILLKTVVMDQNLHDVANVARFADANEMEVFYQPIEQNYNTAEDPLWFEHSPTWPRDTAKAVEAVQELIRLKQNSYPIANSMAQLEVMIRYFQDPDAMRVRVQAHSAHETSLSCAALTMIQIQSNGDVKFCSSQPPLGNIVHTPIREIWNNRPHWWEQGCCQYARFSTKEKQDAQKNTLVKLSA